MIHYNYDCDFKIAEPLYADAPFRYTYYAKSEKTVVAEYDGTDYHGCYPMGDMLIVPINAGSLGLGEVKVRREYYLTDKDFTDGICNRVTGNVPLGIEIWRGETDGMETHEVKVVPAYQKGDPFTFDDMTDAQKQDIANRVPTKEPEREQAEAKREQNELLRQAKEAERETKEAERQSIFSTNEAERQRIFETNEAIRQENESKRVEAEISREERTAAAIVSIANKVDRDDNAPKLTAGFANNLVGRGEATPQEITFRPSGGDTSIEDGTARIDRVKGSTVVWNQIYPTEWTTKQQGVTIASSDGIISLNGTSGYTFVNLNNGVGISSIPYAHKGLYHLDIINDDSDYLQGKRFGLLNRTINTAIEGKSASFFYVNNDETSPWGFGFSRTAVGDTITDVKIRVVIYDLTQMFGAGNEPTTIEDFNAMKPIGIDEYAYNEGELISNNVDELKSVGFNAWDEEWEKGGLSPITGIEEYNDKLIRAKNYIQILPSTIYYCSNENVEGGEATWVMFFDGQKNLIKGYKTGRKTSNNAHDILNHSFTTPATARYMRFYTMSKVYNNDICIHLAHTGYRNGEYEPYKEFRRGIPIKEIKDKDGNQLFPNGLLSAGTAYDEVTATKAIKRIGVVDLGTMNWRRIVENTSGVEWNYFFTSLTFKPNLPSAGGVANAISPLYECAPANAVGDVELRNKTYMIYHSGVGLFFRDDSYTGADAFKAAMSGVMLYYELAEPIEVDLEEPINMDYEVSDFGTEEVISDVPTTPMKADIIYQFNAVDRIRDNSRHTAEADAKLLDFETRIKALEAMIANLTREGDEVLE